jgi:hypothetical protein
MARRSSSQTRTDLVHDASRRSVPAHPAQGDASAEIPPRRRPGAPLGSVKPNSLSQRLARVLIAATSRRGTAVTGHEWRELARAAGVPIHDFHGKVGSLQRLGFVTPVAGRNGRTQYQHRDYPVPPAPDNDPALVVMQIVRELCAKAKRAVSSTEVNREARTRFAPGSYPKMGCGQWLTSLAGHSWTASTGERVPLLERIPVARLGGVHTTLMPATPTVVTDDGTLLPKDMTTHAGDCRETPGRQGRESPLLYWRPTGSGLPLPVTPPPTTRGAALRHIVAQATQALGRPVSTAELRIWCSAHRWTDSVASLFYEESMVGKTPNSAARQRSQPVGLRPGPWVASSGKILRITGPFSCKGGAPMRYAFETPGPRASASMTAWDLCRVLRLDDELRVIRTAEGLGVSVGSPVFASLTALRRALLANAVERFCRSEVGGFSWLIDGARAARRESAILLQWCETAPMSPTGRWATVSQLQDVQRHLDALVALQNEAQTTDAVNLELSLGLQRHPLRIVGDAALLAVGDVDGEAVRAAAMFQLGKTRSATHRICSKVRRFPRANEREFGSARLDRVEFVLSFWDAFQPRIATTLLQNARLLLGCVLRDVDALRAALRVAPLDDDTGRRALVVALGLLGVSMSPAEAITEPDDPAAVATACLAAALAAPADPMPRLEQIEAFLIAERAADAAIGIAITAISRLADGLYFSVVEP